MSYLSPSFYDQVYMLVRCIPAGQVTTYGRVANMLARPRAARAVGYALSALADQAEHGVPWHRVVNSTGRVTIINREHNAYDQAFLLRAEGVAVDEHFKLNLKKYLWGGLSWVELEEIISGRPVE